MRGPELGKQFETLFFNQAQRNGLLVIQNHLTARYIGPGKTIIIRGELDFRLINQDGDVGYFDCKSFGEDHFVYSWIDEHQVKRAALYNEFNVPSGFVIWLRDINQVVFYKGSTIAKRGPGTRFHPCDGIILGTYENFDLKTILLKK